MARENVQDQRILQVIGGDEDLTFDEGVKRFYKHLKDNLELPCEVTGIDDFDWEEYYIFGPGDKNEYRRLKEDCPSYRVCYELLEIDPEVDSEWMMFLGEDIGGRARRLSDGKEFWLGLAEIKATDRKSKNSELLGDYAVWFANSR